MAVQFSIPVRNAMLDVIESTIGTAAKLRYYTGAPPASCAIAPTGTLLVEMALPSDYLSNASSGVKSLTGSWTGTAAAAGTAGYFRLMTSDGATCHMQGTITATGGGGDLTLDNVSIANAQAVTEATFAITAPNA